MSWFHIGSLCGSVLNTTPESCWDTISVDFIVKLPESHGYDAIMNVVDSVSKVSHFNPTHTTITTLGAAHLFVNERQDDWDELLPLAEFQYNNHIHSATQQTPFMLDSGRHLRMGFKPHQAESQLEMVNKFWDQMDSTLVEAKSALAKAKDDMAQYYNQC